ncbi:MAG: phosphatase PAP2 family protein [Sphingobium sp.]
MLLRRQEPRSDGGTGLLPAQEHGALQFGGFQTLSSSSQRKLGSLLAPDCAARREIPAFAGMTKVGCRQLAETRHCRMTNLFSPRFLAPRSGWRSTVQARERNGFLTNIALWSLLKEQGMTWTARALPPLIILAYMVAIVHLRPSILSYYGEVLPTYTASMFCVWAITGAIMLLITMIRRQGQDSGSVKTIIGQFIGDRRKQGGLYSFIMPFFCFVLLLSTFNLFKQFYLPMAGFGFENSLIEADRMLFGQDAWRITHSLLPTAGATKVIDSLYHGWFLPMVIGVALCSFAAPDSILARRYLIAYILLWTVQGSLLAFWMPAAGPALHDMMQGGSTPFTALTHELASQDIWLKAQGFGGLGALDCQERLLKLFGTENFAIGGGISAMPSLHNAMSALFALAAWKLRRTMGVIATLYALFIWIGSVHLGWHYAVDGIVAWIATLMCWWFAGLLARWDGQLWQEKGSFRPVPAA